MGAALSIIDLLARETLLFASFWLLLGNLDELLMDVRWMALKLTGRANPLPLGKLAKRPHDPHLPIAILIPAWREANVLGEMITGCRLNWPDRNIRFFVGCYRNDPETIAVARRAAERDLRFQIVINERDGPTTKGQCLNRLWQAAIDEERLSGWRFAAVMLQDAEDSLHPDAIKTMRILLASNDFVQLPVIPWMDPQSRWISGHYCDEFGESHRKTLFVRGQTSRFMPSAGVGCAFLRPMLERRQRHLGMVFDESSLTEDYELGLSIGRMGGRSKFAWVSDDRGKTIATREFFPSTLDAAVRQKSRWTIGIALEGWDRTGWPGKLNDWWMLARDRIAPWAAAVTLSAYLGLVLWSIIQISSYAGVYNPEPFANELQTLIALNAAFLCWRMVLRGYFTASVYGRQEFVRSMFRMVVSNIISMIAARVAMQKYVKSLFGHALQWDKTEHRIALAQPRRRSSKQ